MFGFFGCMLGSDGLQFKPFIAFCVSNQVDNDTQRHTTTKTRSANKGNVGTGRMAFAIVERFGLDLFWSPWSENSKHAMGTKMPKILVKWQQTGKVKASEELC